ncbi:MAG: hypothetical protein ACOC22_00570 [bacterium]
MTEENKEPKVYLCKMNSNGQITVPRHIRKHFSIDEMENDDGILLAVKFIRIVNPDEEYKNE